ncbi:MAG: YegP family protein [Bacteroidetes bacterium]|nr:YegP family protein [Bacteroidota bacterium]
MGKYIITKSSNGEYRFKLQASNGQTILVSEGYSSKQNCENAIDSVRKHAPDDANYDRKLSSNEKHFFNLKTANGEIIGTSEMYETAAGRDNGIESVKSNAPDGMIEFQGVN